VPKGLPSNRPRPGPRKRRNQKFAYDPALDPWQIQPNEPSTAFAQFRLYLGIDPLVRTIPKAARAYLEQTEAGFGSLAAVDQDARVAAYVHSTMYRTAGDYEWVKRARAYDAFMAAEATAEQVRQTRAVVQRQARMAELGQAMAAKFAQRVLDDKAPNSLAMKIDQMTVMDFVSTLVRVTDLERRIHGLDNPDASDRALAESTARGGGASKDELHQIARDAAREALAAEPKVPDLPPPPDDQPPDGQPPDPPPPPGPSPGPAPPTA
jgi:hypothetical protein